MRILQTLIIILFSVNGAIAQYCTPRTQNLFSHHQIQYFQLDTFIHVTSGVNPKEYNDYSDSMIVNTGISGNHFLLLSKGQDPYNPGAGNTIGFTVWIDFNDDTAFSSDEIIYTKYDGSYTYTGRMAFPGTATTGLHRLRVRDEWGTAPDSPCDTLWGGETEDYTVNVTNADAYTHVAENALKSRFSVYPNPFIDFFTMDLQNIHEHIEVWISDFTGRIVCVKTFDNCQKINLSIEGAPGLYFASINYGNGIEILRLIKK